MSRPPLAEDREEYAYKLPWYGYMRNILKNYSIDSVARCTQREKQAIEETIEQTNTMQDGDLKMRVVDLVLIRRTHTIVGAALKVHTSEFTVKRWCNQFMKRLAENMGLTE